MSICSELMLYHIKSTIVLKVGNRIESRMRRYESFRMKFEAIKGGSDPIQTPI
jgi:hypothetical protein